MLTKLMRTGAILLILTVPAGCATDGRGPLSGLGDILASEDPADLTPAERRLRNDRRVFNETILGGVATGAVAGALIGALIGAASGKRGAIARGALIGGGVGAVAGGLDGWRVATRQEAARKRVREIDLATEKVEAENRRIQASLDNIDVVIADSRRSLRGARSGYRSNRVALDEVRRQEARAERNIRVMDEVIGKQNDRLAEQERIAESYRRDGQNTRQLDRQIAETKRQLKQAERERDALAAELESDRVS